MVCKEEVCTWFRDLQGPKRLEFMCSVLQMCLPLELRFIGSCVEDLAKKDYYYLRDAENRANDPQEVKKLTDIFCRETRGKINTYLALIHSSNTLCSNSVFNTLTCMLPTLEKLYPNIPTDSDFCSEVILSLTMAAYHPSFTFSQRHRLFNELIAVRKLLEDQSSKDCSSSANSTCSSSKHVAVSASPNSIHCSNSHSNVGNVQSSSTCSSSVSSNGNISSNSDNKCNNTTPECNDIITNSAKPTVFVKNLEVKGSQVRLDRKSEFIIQVTWSDGEVTKAYRTYQQLHQFHTELIKLFPKDSGAHKQERQIPFFPQEKGPSHNHSEMETLIKKYIRQLSVLQDHIVQCEHVTTFFRSSMTLMTSHFLTSATTTPPCMTSSSVTTPLRQASMTSTSTSPLTIKVDPSASSSNHSPRSLSASLPGSTSPVYSCSPYPLIHGSPSSSTGSSLASPSSPRMSPSSQLCQGPPGSPKSNIAQWLKKIRLHKYTSNLTKYTWDDLLSLTDEQLDEEGLTAGARKKFFTERLSLISNQTTPNGIVNFDGAMNMLPQSPLSPSPYYTPPQSCMEYPTLSDTSNPYTPPMGRESGNLSGIDCSSASSDYSASPPKTPDPEMKQETLSSEETDRDLSEMEVGPIGKPIIHDGLLPAPNMPHSPLMPELGHFPLRSNGGLLGMPPGMRDGHTSNNAFHHLQTHMDMKSLTEALPLQYPIGVRPLLPPGFFENAYFHPRHVRPPRSQVLHGQGVKPMTLSNSVGSNTTPVMPTPKMPSGSSGIIYENGHQIPPTQSFSYVPNHSQGHVHPHGVPLGAVPLGHHPKANGQYTEGASTPPSMTPSMTTANDTVSYKGPSSFVPPAMISSHGAPPMSSMSGPAMARPSTLGTLASTSLTYSMPHVQPMHHLSVDNNVKQQQQQQQQGPPTPQHPQPSQVAGQSSPAPLQNQVKSGGVVDFGSYANMQQQGTPVSSASAAYNSPSSTPGLQRGNPPTPPAAPPGNSATPQPPHHVPPPRTGTPNTSSSCSSCGCHGNCNNTAPVTPTGGVPPPYPYTYTMWPWQHAFMHSHLPYLPGGTNGLINPTIPFPQMPPGLPNGLSSDVLYSNHHNFIMPGMHSQGPNAGGPFVAYNPNQISVSQATNGNNASKKAMCYNCGHGGHRASECEKPTMETMTHSGSYHLKLRPKSQDSE